MSDPFATRMKFSGLLARLGASTTSAQKAATFAVRNKEQDEDMHSCILETLEDEKCSMNNRANIMYFLEPLCVMAKSQGHLEMVHRIQRDILTIIDAVAPPTGPGAANVKVVRKVLAGLQEKQFLTAKTVKELEDCLKTRDIDTAPTSPGQDGQDKLPSPATTTVRANGHGRVEKRQAEQRIEEDRERHKRLRESIWAIEPEKEFDQLWDDASDIGEDDYLAAEEDAAERKRSEIAVD